MIKKTPESYRARSYRNQVEAPGLVSFSVTVRETDLYITASKKLSEQAVNLVLQARSHLETFIASHPDFLSSLTPLPEDLTAPAIIKKMISAGRTASVGPMAAVAGAIAEFVGQGLLKSGVEEVVVENGGDIFLARRQDCLIKIFAGESVLTNKIGLRINSGQMPLGICTSSGTVGHSLSMGNADSATVVAPSTALADAAATALGNLINDENDIEPALEAARSISGIHGAVLIHGDRLGAWGNISLEPLH